MNRRLEFSLPDVAPDAQSVLHLQGIPPGRTVTDRTERLLSKAMDLFVSSAQPVAKIKGLAADEFEDIYKGEGRNEHDTPLAGIFPQADSLALFALTLGAEVSTRIAELFQTHDFALATMLDAVASAAADKASEVCEAFYFSQLNERGLTLPGRKVLSYSPGYCGWHISGQKKLFHYLEPQQIGVELNDSYLMTPLKSVTGVLVAGKKEVHIFKSDYSFCRTCKTHSCQLRMRA